MIALNIKTVAKTNIDRFYTKTLWLPSNQKRRETTLYEGFYMLEGDRSISRNPLLHGSRR
jgi:hypothetical protein